MQGEYYCLTKKLQDELNKTLSTIKGDMAVAPINLVNEYIYEEMEDSHKDHIFFFRIESITKILQYDFAVRYTLHEHASKRMVNIAQIGVLMALNEPAMTITQAKINDGYLFSTTPLETIINLYEELESPIVEKIAVDINGIEEVIEDDNVTKQ